MTRRAVLGAIAVVAVLAIGGGACSSGSSDDPTPGPTTTAADPATTTAFHDAAAAMEATPNYQYSGTIVAGGTTTDVIGDVAGPDGVRQSTIDADGVVHITVTIGDEAWTKSGPAGWEPAPDSTAPDPDTRALFAALAEATVVSGTPTDVIFDLGPDSPYLETLGGAEKVSGQATIVDGLITRLYYGVSGSVESQLITLDLVVPGLFDVIDRPV